MGDRVMRSPRCQSPGDCGVRNQAAAYRTNIEASAIAGKLCSDREFGKRLNAPLR